MDNLGWEMDEVDGGGDTSFASFAPFQATFFILFAPFQGVFMSFIAGDGAV